MFVNMDIKAVISLRITRGFSLLCNTQWLRKVHSFKLPFLQRSNKRQVVKLEENNMLLKRYKIKFSDSEFGIAGTKLKLH